MGFRSTTNLRNTENASKKLLLSAYMKILTNFMQSLAIIACLNLDWGELAEIFLPIVKSSAGNMHKIISLECLIGKTIFFIELILIKILQIDSEIAFFLKIGSVLLQPFLIGIFLLLFWLFAIKIYGLNIYESFSNFLKSMSILIILSLSSIINCLFEFLNCVKIDGKEYVASSLNIVCESENYTHLRNTIVIPSFVFYLFVFPTSIFTFMFFNRKSLFSGDCLSKIGFLLNGYKKNTYYW